MPKYIEAVDLKLHPIMEMGYAAERSKYPSLMIKDAKQRGFCREKFAWLNFWWCSFLLI